MLTASSDACPPPGSQCYCLQFTPAGCNVNAGLQNNAGVGPVLRPVNTRFPCLQLLVVFGRLLASCFYLDTFWVAVSTNKSESLSHLSKKRVVNR